MNRNTTQTLLDDFIVNAGSICSDRRLAFGIRKCAEYKVGISERIIRRRAFAKLTLMRSIVNLSCPFSSVLDTMRGIYLDTAVAE